MDRFSRVDWVVAVALVALAPGFVLLVGGSGLISGWMASPAAQAWAAWVQAVGSIAAIGGAAWIASRQARETLANERRQAAVRINSLARLLGAVKDAVQGLAELQMSDRQRISGLMRVDAYAEGRKFQVLRDAVVALRLDQQSSEAVVLALAEVQAGIVTLTGPGLTGNYEAFEDPHKGLESAEEFVRVLEQRILLLRSEANRLWQGEGPATCGSASA